MNRRMVYPLLLLAGVQPGVPLAAEKGHAHMNDDPLVWKVLGDELEWQDASPDDALAWNLSAWIGHDTGRLLFRSEGEALRGDAAGGRAELLWSKPVAAFWDLVGGLRQDFGEGSGRTYGLIGVQGTAPYRVHIEADVFGGERGQVGTRLEATYEILLTNRWMAEPRVELQAFGRDDVDTGIGSGPSGVEAGLRLRYEIRREFAPYVGVEWSGTLGDTADLARAADEPVRDTRFVAGLRVWF